MWNGQFGAKRSCRQATTVITDPPVTRSQVTTWKNPSATTLARSPASVVVGLPGTLLIM